MRDSRFALAFFLVTTFVFAMPNFRTDLEAQFAAHDPGPRGAPVGAGGAVQGLTPTQKSFFEDGLGRFLEIDSVGGTLSGETGRGLGPGFNSNQCASCHSQPATGGSSPSRHAFPFIGPNPQVAVANLDGATNIVPFFVTEDGPVRELRFKYFLTSAGILSQQRDGGVHNVFTIQGRVDATKTAPLWGLGQRVFFLHDGRTQDLVEAIEQHASSGSEGGGVVSRYNHLNENQKQDLLNFLRSL